MYSFCIRCENRSVFKRKFMCLYLRGEKQPIVAESDIVVYKAVKIHKASMNMYSEFHGYRYRLGGEYRTYLRGIPLKWEKCGVEVQVIDYGFHSYVYKEDAEEECTSHMYVIRCVIPRGSNYWKGVDCNGKECYCSDNIKVERIE